MEDFLDRAEVAEQGDTSPTRVLDHLVGEHEWGGTVRALNSGLGSGGSRSSPNQSRPPE